MNRDQVLKIIAAHREKLAGDFGIKSLALFGSVVRDEATAASDVDLLVEFDTRPVGLFHLSRTQHYLESILGVPHVDLVLREGIKPALRDRHSAGSRLCRIEIELSGSRTSSMRSAKSGATFRTLILTPSKTTSK